MEKPKIVIHTGEMTPELRQLAQKLRREEQQPIPGTMDSAVYRLQLKDIDCFYGQNKQIFAKTDAGSFAVKQKLYELEEMLREEGFLRISNSVIANAERMKCLDMSLNGTIRITFLSGNEEYSSRRYVTKIRKQLGI